MNETVPTIDEIFTDTAINKTSHGRHLLILSIFFLITPLTLFVSILSLYTMNIPKETKGSQVYASLPDTIPEVSGSVIGDDARVLVLEKYLEMNTSPLTQYARLLVETADTYNLDWKLLPAIAQKESGLCHVIPENSHNCWGWGIHSKGTLLFDDYKEAITTVAKGLKEKYIDEGFTTPDKIMEKYAHPDSTTWADGVSMYMEQIKNVSVN
jgi:hypothetical protein